MKTLTKETRIYHAQKQAEKIAIGNHHKITKFNRHTNAIEATCYACKGYVVIRLDGRRPSISGAVVTAVCDNSQ